MWANLSSCSFKHGCFVTKDWWIHCCLVASNLERQRRRRPRLRQNAPRHRWGATWCYLGWICSCLHPTTSQHLCVFSCEAIRIYRASLSHLLCAQIPEKVMPCALQLLPQRSLRSVSDPVARPRVESSYIFLLNQGRCGMFSAVGLIWRKDLWQLDSMPCSIECIYS